MSSWKDKLEAWFSAVAFAEAGEHETALRMTAPSVGNAVEATLSIDGLNRVFAAAAFAEADCHQIAREILAPRKGKDSFLDRVGLRGVGVRMCRVPVHQESFVDFLGLQGIRITSGKVLV
ncbi:MAG: hypothetical protein V1792_07115 [Pseudomonadota bacterium]